VVCLATPSPIYRLNQILNRASIFLASEKRHPKLLTSMASASRKKRGIAGEYGSKTSDFPYGFWLLKVFL